MKIDINSPTIQIHDSIFNNIDIHELKAWIDEQIKQGKTKINTSIEWGYYNDIDSIEITATI